MAKEFFPEKQFLEDVRKAKVRTGRMRLQAEPAATEIQVLSSVACYLVKTFQWNHRAVPDELFLDLAAVDLWESFLGDTNAELFREEVIILLTSSEIGSFVKACLDSTEKFYYDGSGTERAGGPTRVPAEGKRWNDLLREWRENPDVPIEWLLLVI